MRGQHAIVAASLVVIGVTIANPAIGKEIPQRPKAILGVVTLKGGPPLGQATPPGKVGSRCSGTTNGDLPFTSDLVGGAPVVVRNASDKIVAKTTLHEGVVANLVSQNPGSPSSTDTYDCQLLFRTKKLPKSNSYSISIGQREGVVIPRSGLEKYNWLVRITYPDSI